MALARAPAPARTSSVLPRPGDAFDQHVPRGHERDEHLLDRGVLTHHRLADRTFQALQQLSRLGDRVRLDFHGTTFHSDSASVFFVNEPAPHRLDEGDRLSQLVRAPRATVIHGRPERRSVRAGELRDGIDALDSPTSAKTPPNTSRRRFVQARTAAACNALPPPKRMTNNPVPRICSASERRARSGSGGERAEAQLFRHRASAMSASASSTTRPAEHP